MWERVQWERAIQASTDLTPAIWQTHESKLLEVRHCEINISKSSVSNCMNNFTNDVDLGYDPSLDIMTPSLDPSIAAQSLQ